MPFVGVAPNCAPYYDVTTTSPSSSGSDDFNQVTFQAFNGEASGGDNVSGGTGTSGCTFVDGAVYFYSCSTQACEDKGGGGTGGCGTDALSDSSSALAVSPDQLCGPSPIVLDIDGRGFFLTSAENGVKFDISGTGHPIQMGWTAQGAANAFLALPGVDGLIHNGKQLFGNFTPQPPSKTSNGFAALAVYDLPANGGNGDGIIDKRDGIFSSLRLWIDKNHDGIAQPEEIYTLPALGINSISLKYTLDWKTDQYGNRFRYRAALNPDKPDEAGKIVYDIFFVTLDSSKSASLCLTPPIAVRGSRIHEIRLWP